MILSAVCATAGVWWGIDLAQSYGSRAADGGALAPLALRLALGVGVASLGVLFAAGMWLYGRCYVAQMDLDRPAGKLHVRTVRFFGSKAHVFDVSDVSGGGHHEGRFDASSADAPWTSVSVSGRCLPLILDEQGEFPQGKTTAGLLGPAPQNEPQSAVP